MDGRAVAPPPNNVLIVRPSALGDVCRSVPVLATLRQALPKARIDWLVHDRYQDAVRHHPDLDNVVPFPRDALGLALRTGRGAGAALAWLRALRSRRYDLVVDLQGLMRSGLVTRLSGARQRVGFRNAAELAFLGYNKRYRIDREMHSVDRMLTLVERIGFKRVVDMHLNVGSGDENWLDQWLEDTGLGPDTAYACLAPTARWASKCWPLERYAVLARRLLDEGPAGRHILVLAAPGEREQVQRLSDLVGQAAERLHFPTTTVGGLLAVIRRSRLLVSNDSAAMHVAVGFDRPLVAIFGPTQPQLVGPYGRAECVVTAGAQIDARTYRRHPHDQSLIGRIDVETVWAKVLKQLDAGAHGEGRPSEKLHPKT